MPTRHPRPTDGSRSPCAPSHRPSMPTHPKRHGTGSTTAASRPGRLSCAPNLARCQLPRPTPASPGRSAPSSSYRSPTVRPLNSQPAHTPSRPSRPTELQLSLRVQGGSLRSPRAARPPAGPALLSPPRFSPAGARAARMAISHLTPDKGYVVAGAVGSTALRSHFGASLEDHGPNVVLYRAGPQTARRAGSLRGHDHSRQSSATPKPLHRPHVTTPHTVGLNGIDQIFRLCNTRRQQPYGRVPFVKFN
jgi:hypothetical protein